MALALPRGGLVAILRGPGALLEVLEPGHHRPRLKILKIERHKINSIQFQAFSSLHLPFERHHAHVLLHHSHISRVHVAHHGSLSL